LYRKEPSTIKDVKARIVDYLTSLGGLDLMEYAIDQGVRIIYFNITYVYLGEICRKFLIDINKNYHLGYAVQYSVGMANQIISTDLPMIVCICNSGYDYEVNALCIDIPVIVENGKLKLDRALCMNPVVWRREWDSNPTLTGVGCMHVTCISI
jgi:hypothetical protein